MPGTDATFPVNGPSAEVRCEYTAKASKATLVDLSPNTVQVLETKEVNGRPTVTSLYDCGADVCKASGTGKSINTTPGATITIVLSNADSPEGFCPICGTVGSAAIYEAA